MQRKLFFVILVIGCMMLLIVFFRFSPFVIKNVSLNSDEEACLGELIGILDPGQDWGIIKITGKEGSKINLHLYTLLEFNREWFAECPEGRIGSKY